MFLDSRRDFFRHGTAIADAGCTAIPDHIEAQCFQRRQQIGLAQVFGNYPRARCQARLHIGRHLQAALHCFFRQNSRRNHHGRIGRIGA